MAPDLDLTASPPHSVLSRRTVLRGAAALGAIGAVGGLGLTACGDDDGDGEGSAGPGDPADAANDAYLSLITLLNSTASLAAGEEARVPIAVGDDQGALTDETPGELTFTVRTADGEVVAEGLTVARRAEGLPHAYYPLAFTPASAGDYIAATEIDGAPLETALSVSEPDAIAIPRPGQAFPSVTTPTVDDPGGVDPICTRRPACPLHDEEVGGLLGTAPIALLVSTPAFCQTTICGPVLDLLVEARDQAPDVRFVHVEVYETAAEVEEEGLQATLAPAVDALGLPFEPCLFLIAADGTLRSRLDIVFDRSEVDEALAALTA